MPWKAASTVSAGQTMQTPTVHPPAATARMRNTNIGAHSKGNGNPKTLGVQQCPKRRNRQSIEPSPALSLCRGQQSGSTHLICHTQHVFPISLNNRKVPGFLTTRVIWQGSGAPPLAPLQDSTASASSLVSAMLILERIVAMLCIGLFIICSYLIFIVLFLFISVLFIKQIFGNYGIRTPVQIWKRYIPRTIQQFLFNFFNFQQLFFYDIFLRNAYFMSYRSSKYTTVNRFFYWFFGII